APRGEDRSRPSAAVVGNRRPAGDAPLRRRLLGAPEGRPADGGQADRPRPARPQAHGDRPGRAGRADRLRAAGAVRLGGPPASPTPFRADPPDPRPPGIGGTSGGGRRYLRRRRRPTAAGAATAPALPARRLAPAPASA